jgi:hypothetical protein
LSILLTLLRRASSKAQSGIPAVGRIRASIELLVAAPGEGSGNVDEGVVLDLEWTVGDSGVLDGSCGDATEGGSEGLEVASGLTALGGESGGRAESGGDEGGDDECGLHFDGLGVCEELIGIDGYRTKR